VCIHAALPNPAPDYFFAEGMPISLLLQQPEVSALSG